MSDDKAENSNLELIGYILTADDYAIREFAWADEGRKTGAMLINAERLRETGSTDVRVSPVFAERGDQ